MSQRTDLADELAGRWHDLGALLRSRRLLASLHGADSKKLTPSKLRALAVIAEADGLRIGELAERVGIEETTATRLVDRLAEEGLAERRGLPGDRRVALVVLTAAGKRLARAVAEQRRRFFADVLETLQPDERAELVRLTTKAAHALQATTEELIAR